jgi:hypothetical protein
MPGVFRPMTLVDVINTLNQQNNQGQQGTDMINGLGEFAETAESFAAADSMATTVQASPGWDQGVWGAFTWA